MERAQLQCQQINHRTLGSLAVYHYKLTFTRSGKEIVSESWNVLLEKGFADVCVGFCYPFLFSCAKSEGFLFTMFEDGLVIISKSAGAFEEDLLWSKLTQFVDAIKDIL
jgi:hypothetical protein